MNSIDLNSIKDQYKTNQTKKMNINWRQEIMTVYRIPLDLLYYNDQNDRIATYISKFNADRDIKLSDLPTEERNELIEKYIIDSDQDKYARTRENIRNLSQLEPWVVLADWRVIDWNRRFTCLRNLHRETWDQKFNFFETIILDKDITEKQIKIMELIIQHWKDEKVDYNPIEKLVWIYRDLIKEKKLSVEEYANSIAVSKKAVLKSMDLANLMEDFLEYMNAPEKFYIAKELEIDWPLNEIYNIKKRLWDDEETRNDVRSTLYDMLIARTSWDMTREIREFWKNVIPNKKKFWEFLETNRDASKKLRKKLNECEWEITTAYIRNTVRTDSEIREEMKANVENTTYTVKKEKLKVLPIEQLKEINDDLDKLDITAISRLQWEDKENFIEQLDLMKEKIKQFNEKLNNGVN